MKTGSPLRRKHPIVAFRELFPTAAGKREDDRPIAGTAASGRVSSVESESLRLRSLARSVAVRWLTAHADPHGQ